MSVQSYLRRSARAGLTAAERADQAAGARELLRSWNGYDPTPEEEARLDADLDRQVAEARSRLRPGTAEHFAALPAVDLLDLDLPAALAVALDTTWGLAHTRHAAAPTPERPSGAVVATADPDRWSGHRVPLIDVRPR